MGNYYQEERDIPEFDSVAEFAEDIVYLVPGCDRLMIRKTIQQVFRDFCHRSCALLTVRRIPIGRERSFPIVAVTPECTVDVIAEVKVGDRVLHDNDRFLEGYKFLGDCIILNRCECDHLPPGYEGDEALKFLNVEQSVHPDYVSSKCEPEILSITQVEVPKSGSEKAPRWFVAKYKDAIVEGVLARLMMMTGKAWSDAQMAQMHLNSYEGEVSAARMAYYNGGNYSNGAMAGVKEMAL